MKKELTLEGLNCKKCIKNIKDNIELENIDVNYNEMNISFVVDEGNEYNRIIKIINKVLSGHRHQVRINEKYVENLDGKTLFIGRLTCSNCARKIETKVRNLAGVKNADLDFVNSKLTIEVNSKSDLSRVVKETKGIVKAVEPDAYVEDVDSNKHEHDHHHHGEGEIISKTLFRLGLGTIFFVLALLLKIDDLYKLGLFLVSYLIIGRSVIIKAIKNIFHGNVFDENTLMMVATIGAFIIGEYHEAVAVMAFYLVGEMFQDLAVDQSRKSIAKLMDIKSDYANLKVNDDLVKVTPDEVKIGSLIVVKPGEKVPLDGIVVEGEGNLDTSHITGEGMPRYVRSGNEVLSGFINLDKILVIETTKEYDDSTVSKIIEMVESASSKKAPTENFITKFARVYTPIVVFIALVLAVLPPILLGQEFSIWIYRALSFLVVSCPCALVISVPLGFYGGIGFASRNGILIKGGNYLEALKNSEEIVFDKTGTLTTGKFVVQEVNTIDYSKEELLEIASYSEYYSIHPIATAIKNVYQKDFDLKRIKKYQEFAGLGISVKLDNLNVLIGNKSLMENNNIEFIENNSIGTILYIAINGKYQGNIVIGDQIKPEAKATIAALRDLGISRFTMITGDKEKVAMEVAKNLDIDEVYAEVLPNEKVEILESKVKSSNKKIVFVGDGVNDAPVLAISDIGISMGSMGSDAAIEASDVVIMNDDLSKINDAKYIAKKTSKVVWQNILFAILVKVLVLILAAFGIVNMWIAVFADVGVSLIAIINAMRILRTKLKNRSTE